MGEVGAGEEEFDEHKESAKGRGGGPRLTNVVHEVRKYLDLRFCDLQGVVPTLTNDHNKKVEVGSRLSAYSAIRQVHL